MKSIHDRNATRPGGGQQRVKLLLTLAMVLMLAGCGITAPRNNDGYANLDSPGMNETNRTMALSLGPTVLHFAARYMDDDPETQALLRSLEGVRIRIYEVSGDTDKIARNFENMGQKLGDDGWNPIMLVREEGELVQMYAKTGDDRILGLTIVSADDEEVVIVNVMGDIDPAQYTEVIVALDVDEAPEAEVATMN
jgi:hypothetical protein